MHQTMAAAVCVMFITNFRFTLALNISAA